MLKPLTSLRFFFALMIFVSHLDFLAKSDSAYLRWLYASIFKEGYIGVSFFFILSGFILAYNYQDSILSKGISTFNFYVARFARIYPLHLICLVVAIPLSLHEYEASTWTWTKMLIANLTLTQSFIPLKSFYFSFNAPSWSISNEFFFYLLFPLLIVLVEVFRRKRYIVFAVCTIVVLLLILMCCIPTEFHHATFYINPLFRIFDFLLGIFLYQAFLEIKKYTLPLNATLLEITALLGLLLFFAFHSGIPKVLRYSVYYWIPVCFLLVTFAFQKGHVSSFLSKKAFIVLGEISFGFYMIHQLVLRYFDKLNTPYFQLENEYIVVLLTFGLTLFLSYISYYYVEIPTNGYLKRKMQYNKQQTFERTS